jgi:hypothetical protein
MTLSEAVRATDVPPTVTTNSVGVAMTEAMVDAVKLEKELALAAVPPPVLPLVGASDVKRATLTVLA